MEIKRISTNLKIFLVFDIVIQHEVSATVKIKIVISRNFGTIRSLPPTFDKRPVFSAKHTKKDECPKIMRYTVVLYKKVN